MGTMREQYFFIAAWNGTFIGRTQMLSTLRKENKKKLKIGNGNHGNRARGNAQSMCEKVIPLAMNILPLSWSASVLECMRTVLCIWTQRALIEEKQKQIS